MKLERFLDPTKVRSELLQQFREGGVAPLPNYGFEDSTLFDSHRAPLRWMRRLLRPFLKLLFNPNPLIHVLHMQADINNRQAQYTELSYEILHNLVLEVTRLGIEVKNLKMRVESLSGRLDFDERRARALESVVQYRPGEGPEERAEAATAQAAREGTEQQAGGGPAGETRRRRRRRRGRRGGAGRAAGGEEPSAGAQETTDETGEAAGAAFSESTDATQSSRDDEGPAPARADAGPEATADPGRPNEEQ